MTSRKRRERISRRVRHAGIDPAPEILDGLDAYLTELSHWNARINLTAFKLGEDPSDDAVDRLLVEPILAAKLIPASTAQVLDIGSGGGSPAIPLKIARPELHVTMVEVKLRKSAFLRQVVRRLGLVNAIVENVRAEELLTRPELHSRFDVATIRAVRLDTSLWAVLQSLLTPVGTVVHFATADQSIAPPPPFVSQSRHRLRGHGTVLAVSAKAAPIGGRFT